MDVRVVGNYAYVANYDSGLQIFNISNPSAPNLTGSYDIDGVAYDVQVVGDYAYVGSGNLKLRILNISNPLAPTLAGSYDSSGQGVQVVGNYAYVPDGGRGLKILNVTNPSAPTLVASYETGNATDVQVIGNYAYVAGGYSGLQIFNISNPSAPALAASYDTNGSAFQVQVVGNYAYIADYSSGLQIINISNPLAPTLAGSYNTTYGIAYDVQVVGNYAYVAGGTSGLQIINISNPSAPTLAGSYDALYDAVVDGVEIVENYAYISYVYYDDVDNERSGLQIINISNPFAPTLAGSYDTGYVPSPSRVGLRENRVQVVGNYAYIANRDSGLQILNISNPSAPTLAGSYDTLNSAQGVKIVGNYAYISDQDLGLQILNISNPSAPTFAGSYDSGGSPHGVQIVGNYAYVADGLGGLKILDVSDFVAATLSINDVTISEGDRGTKNATFTVTRTGTATNTITVDYTTAPHYIIANNRRATEGQDYIATNGSLTFTTNETTKNITVAILGDTTSEEDEVFFVNLTNATNAIIDKSQGLGTITNDDFLSQWWQLNVPFISDTNSQEVKLWLYGQQPSSNTAPLAIQDTIVITNGWLGKGVTSAPSDPTGFGAEFTNIAKNLFNYDNAQILFLDWGKAALDPFTIDFWGVKIDKAIPDVAAGRIIPVANWAKEQLEAIKNSGHKLTLIGHSLGSYVSAEIAERLGIGNNVNIVTLDPAAYGPTPWDLNKSNNTSDPVSPFRDVVYSPNSLSLVVSDSDQSRAVAGDNDQSGTAHYSFLVDNFPPVTDPFKDAGDAHGAVKEVYSDLVKYLDPSTTVYKELFTSFKEDQYKNNGAKESGPHEGVFNIQKTSDSWRIERIYGVHTSGAERNVYFSNKFDTINPSESGTAYDTVISLKTFTLNSGIEELILGGTEAINGVGNDSNNRIIGNTEANTLDGKIGVDTLIGGLGNDTYIVDDINDQIIETSTLTTEIDTVKSSTSYTLSANLENLIFSGLYGNGNALNNTLTGNNGANILDGKEGADTLIGGEGNDTYIVDNVGDIVIETATFTTEIDIVQSSVTFSLLDLTNVENLTLIGTAAIDGRGNTGNNTLIGNSADNALTGGDGNDLLSGGAGDDYLVGGLGNDTLEGGIGSDQIDGIAGNNTINGVDQKDNTPGLGEIDYLTGGTGDNLFILGDVNKAYYDDGNTLTNGSNDYANISDFNSGDTIQLHGTSGDYLLTVVGTETQILLNKPNAEPDELIAIVRNQTTLNLTNGSFIYLNDNTTTQDISQTVSKFSKNTTTENQGSLTYDLSSVTGNIKTQADDTAFNQTNALFHNLVGLYQVENTNGAILDTLDLNGNGATNDLLNPGDAGYARTAITNTVNNFILQMGANSNPAKNTNAAEFGDVLLQGGKLYAPFAIANGGNLIPTGGTLQDGINTFLAQNPNNTAANLSNFMTHAVAYFSFGNANPDGTEHLQNRGNNVFGFEDLPGNLGISDFDFNDAVFKFTFIG